MRARRTQPAELPTELIRVRPECRCGCGKSVPKTKPGKRARIFCTASCRSRFMRSRKAAAGFTVRAPWKSARRRKEVQHG
jgi:hypothetical protein